MDSYEEIKAQVEKDIEHVYKECLLLCVIHELGREKNLTLHQQSDFFTPWGNRPKSEEEEIHQDLVWIHKVLPPNDKFNPTKAKEGFYKALKVQLLDEFWEKHVPQRKNWKNYVRREKKQKHIKIQVKPPTRRCRGQTNGW